MLPELNLTPELARSIKKITIVACGTAWHAGTVGKVLIEKIARLPVEVDIASEFRYRDPIVDSDTVILAISQSPVLDLFGDLAPELSPAGFIATDPETLATSIPGVWAGGDVAAHGPASIVKAAADGKRAAAAIGRRRSA